MNCTNCGNPLHEGDKFCPACGARVEPFSAAPAPALNPSPVPAQPAAIFRQPEPVTAGQRWLLLGVILLGTAFQFIFFNQGQRAGSTTWYAIFWLVYLAVFHAVCWEQARARPLGFLPAAVAAFLCAMVIAQGGGYSDPELLFWNCLVIPGVLMVHAQYVTRPLPREHESGYFGLFFTGFFVQPFQYIGRFFTGAGSLFTGKGKEKSVWLGVLVAVPVLIVVVTLLLSADAVINGWAQKVLHNLDLFEFVGRLCVIAVCAILFYSFLYGVRWAQPKEFQAHETRIWSATPFNIVLCALIAVYAAFSIVQFVYLFAGHGLPDGLTYSKYAVEGFNQLMWVAAINFTALSLCLCRAQRTKLLDVLMPLLLLMTAVILASAFTRLLLYISAYGLTFRRVQAFWFLCYLGAVAALYAVRVYVPRFPLLRVSALLLLLWYVALNIPNLAAWYTPALD